MMNTQNIKKWFSAVENSDGTFSLKENPERKYSYEDFKKLKALCGGGWTVFKHPDSKNPLDIDAIIVDFKRAQ